MDRASKSSFVDLRLEVQEKVLNVSAVVARKDHDITRNDSQVSLQLKRRAQIYSPLQQIPNKSDMSAIRAAPYKQYSRSVLRASSRSCASVCTAGALLRAHRVPSQSEHIASGTVSGNQREASYPSAACFALFLSRKRCNAYICPNAYWLWQPMTWILIRLQTSLRLCWAQASAGNSRKTPSKSLSYHWSDPTSQEAIHLD